MKIYFIFPRQTLMIPVYMVQRMMKSQHGNQHKKIIIKISIENVYFNYYTTVTLL